MKYVVINYRQKCADGHYSDRAMAEAAMWRWKKIYRHDDFHIYEMDKGIHPLVTNDETFMPCVYREHIRDFS